MIYFNFGKYGGDRTIKVYGFKEQGHGIMEIEADLNAEQAFVGGRTDVYAVTDYLDLVFNRKVLVAGWGARVAVMGEGDKIIDRGVLAIIHGDCFVCRHDGRGNHESLNENDVQIVRHYVKEVMFVGHGIVIFD